MQMNGKFVYITGSCKEVNGRTYCRVSIDSGDQVVEVTCEPKLKDQLKKYQPYIGTFDYIVYHSEKGSSAYLKLIEAKQA